MMRFNRAPPPLFWREKETQWATRPDWEDLKPLGWKHERQSLRRWFHQLCRADGGPQLCVYCDGPLNVTSRKTVDHFFPWWQFPELAIDWHNLYPACDLCNEGYKGEQWSCALLRPDLDPVEDWFDIDMRSGKLRANPAIQDITIRARVRLTIRVFGLNETERCTARLQVLSAMRDAWKPDADSDGQRNRPAIVERAKNGPHRIVAVRFLQSVEP